MNFKVRIFVVTTALAVLFWFVNRMNQEFTVVKTFRIQYNGLALTGAKPDSVISVEITGKGFSLLNYYFSESNSIVLTKSDFAATKRGDTVLMTLSPDNLQAAIQRSLPEKIRISQVPDKPIIFTSLAYLTREIPVKVKTEGELPADYMISGPVKTRPGKVKVTGPTELIQAIDLVETASATLSGRKDTLFQTLALITFPDKRIRFETPRVEIEIPISTSITLQKTAEYSFTENGIPHKGMVQITYVVPEGMQDEPIALQYDIRDNTVFFRVKAHSLVKIISLTPSSLSLEP